MESTHAIDSWARDFDELAGILEDLKAGISPAELHGTIAGLHCGRVKGSPSDWLASFLADLQQDQQAMEEEISVNLVESDADTLKRLYELTAKDLESEQFEFKLILPDDDHYTLPDRVTALTEWVRGYLLGVGLSGAVDPSVGQPSGSEADEMKGERFGAEIQEALEDLVAISQADSSVAEENDNERYYCELVEYVKILVLTLKNGLKPVSVH